MDKEEIKSVEDFINTPIEKELVKEEPHFPCKSCGDMHKENEVCYCGCKVYVKDASCNC